MKQRLLSFITILFFGFIYSQTPPCGITYLTECNDGSFIGDGVLIDLTQLNTEYPFCYTNADYTKYNTPTHHNSLEDANAGINPINNPEAYEVAITYGEETETIYARAEPIEMGLPTLVDVFCEVKGAEPPSVVVTDFSVYDENGDGYAVFDLESKSIEIASSSNFIYTYVTFHLNLDDVFGDTNAIYGDYINTVQNEQTVFARASPDFNPACFSYHEMKLIASSTLSTNNPDSDLFTLSPNPASDLVHLSFGNGKSSIYQLKLFDIHGNRLWHQDEEIYDDQTIIDVSKFQSGFYFVKVTSGNYEITKKLIVK